MEKRRTRYELKCSQCYYHYWVETFEKPEWERCPICGHFGRLDEFLVKQPP